MIKFVIRRLLLLIPILLGLSFLLFMWVRALPGGPATALLGERASPERIAQVNRLYGFDKPVIEQYFKYLGRIVRFDFGQSITLRKDVTAEMLRRFPATVELSLAAMVFAVGLGIPLGFVAAKRERTWVDNSSMIVSLVGVSVPVFFLAQILKYFFAQKLSWLPTIGRLSPVRDLQHHTNFNLIDSLIEGDFGAFWDTVQHMILPGIALGTIPLAIIARITRASVLEVLNEDFVRTARAKGMSRSVVDRRHVLRNAMLPIVTVIGLQTGLLLSGAVLTEKVFAWGGLGELISGAVLDKDYPVIQGGVLFLAVVFVLVNLTVDMLYAVIDPRIRVT
ncbi:MAG TPA: ABC transporter permease [Ilumatobacteraceae bacterium]|nr:ABC transporter permease [Ilumatobacteraceae bacterium]